MFSTWSMIFDAPWRPGGLKQLANREVDWIIIGVSFPLSSVDVTKTTPFFFSPTFYYPACLCRQEEDVDLILIIRAWCCQKLQLVKVLELRQRYFCNISDECCCWTTRPSHYLLYYSNFLTHTLDHLIRESLLLVPLGTGTWTISNSNLWGHNRIAFSSFLSSRFGLFNNCLLGSDVMRQHLMRSHTQTSGRDQESNQQSWFNGGTAGTNWEETWNQPGWWQEVRRADHQPLWLGPEHLVVTPVLSSGLVRRRAAWWLDVCLIEDLACWCVRTTLPVPPSSSLFCLIVSFRHIIQTDSKTWQQMACCHLLLCAQTPSALWIFSSSLLRFISSVWPLVRLPFPTWP